MQRPKITVVTVCYNAVDTIENTVLSVLNQTYDNIEYIIIDGGSTDGTVDIIKKYADKIAYWVSEPDNGIYDAMNKGIDIATGDYINFMNAGDRFANNMVVQSVFSKLSDEKDIIYGDVIQMYRGKLLIQKPAKLSKICEYQPFCHQSTFVRTVLMKLLKFDSSFRILGDYNFFYYCYKSGKRFFYIPIVISVYNSTEGISTDSLKESLYEQFRILGIENDLLLQFPRRIRYIKNRFFYKIKKRLSSDSVALIRKIIHRKRIRNYN